MELSLATGRPSRKFLRSNWHDSQEQAGKKHQAVTRVVRSHASLSRNIEALTLSLATSEFVSAFKATGAGQAGARQAAKCPSLSGETASFSPVRSLNGGAGRSRAIWLPRDHGAPSLSPLDRCWK